MPRLLALVLVLTLRPSPAATPQRAPDLPHAPRTEPREGTPPHVELPACSPPDAREGGGARAPACPPLLEDAKWTVADGPRHVDCHLTVVDARLELEPGVRVEFGPGAGLALGPGGLLLAQGEPWSPVVLAGRAGAGPGSWEGVRFERGSRSEESQLDQVHLLGAGDRRGASLSWQGRSPLLGVVVVSGAAGDAVHGPPDSPAPSLAGLLAWGLGGVPACAVPRDAAAPRGD